MELTWKQLMQVMEKMSKQTHQLITIAERLNQAIHHEQVELIGQLVIEQEQAMKVFDEYEQQRMALVRTIGEQCRIEQARINAAALLPHMPPEWSNDYRLHITKLKQGMEDLKKINTVNQKLLNQSRQFMSWLINYLVTPVGAAAMYDAAGISVQNSSYHVVNQTM